MRTNHRLEPASMRTAFTAALMALCLVPASAKEPMSAQLGEIYNRNAQYHGPGRNPVIVIPGILGSTLKDEESGRVVWGGFVRDHANPSRPDGARLVALPMERGVPLSRLREMRRCSDRAH